MSLFFFSNWRVLARGCLAMLIDEEQSLVIWRVFVLLCPVVSNGLMLRMMLSSKVHIAGLGTSEVLGALVPGALVEVPTNQVICSSTEVLF